VGFNVLGSGGLYYSLQFETGLSTGVFTSGNLGTAYLSFSEANSGCGNGGQRIDVLDVDYSDGQLASFAATFEIHCQLGDGFTSAPAIFGDISYHSTAPFYAADLSDDLVEIPAGGLAPTAVEVTLTNTGANDLNPYGFNVEGSDPQDFEIYSNTCNTQLVPGAVCNMVIAYFPPSLGSSDNATLVFFDQLTPDVSAPGGLGSGRHILIYGMSFNGYYVAHASGAINPFGAAPAEGNPSGLNRPVVGVASVPFGVGYWLVSSDGGVFNYGDAGFFGSAGNIALNKPIVGMAATSDGGGYWLVASDGGIFSYGDAHFYGSTGSLRLNRPVVGMASTPDGPGYWLVASDGGYSVTEMRGSTALLAI
jgi:hypothetical protein